MKEIFVLAVGFAAGTKVWLAAFDLNSYRKKRDRQHVTRAYRGIQRLGVAGTMGILCFALTRAETIELTVIGVAYLLFAALLLFGAIGELNTYDWEEEEEPLPRV